jgi:hypothetical protein
MSCFREQEPSNAGPIMMTAQENKRCLRAIQEMINYKKFIQLLLA